MVMGSGQALPAGRGAASRRIRRLASVALICTGVVLGTSAPVFAADDGPRQWYLKSMRAEEMWKVSTGKGVTVAVLDTGVRETPGLRGRVLPEAYASEDEAADQDGHGTSMSELIAGSGDDGSIKGVAPDATILPVKVKFGLLMSSDTIAKGIRAAADSEAKIINLSLMVRSNEPELRKAVDYALDKGKLLVAAAGNESDERTNFPAAYPGVAGITATGESGELIDLSSYGPTTALAAPGGDVPIWCDENFEDYCLRAGTSAAAAITSGAAALLWAAHPDWTANQVLNVLVGTADDERAEGPAPDKRYGYGGIRPYRNLVEGKGDPGDPGDPGSNPLVNGVIAPFATTSERGDATGSDSRESFLPDLGPLWIIIGAGIVTAGLLCGVVVLRGRRQPTGRPQQRSTGQPVLVIVSVTAVLCTAAWAVVEVTGQDGEGDGDAEAAQGASRFRYELRLPTELDDKQFSIARDLSRGFARQRPESGPEEAPVRVEAALYADRSTTNRLFVAGTSWKQEKPEEVEEFTMLDRMEADPAVEVAVPRRMYTLRGLAPVACEVLTKTENGKELTLPVCSWRGPNTQAVVTDNSLSMYAIGPGDVDLKVMAKRTIDIRDEARERAVS